MATYLEYLRAAMKRAEYELMDDGQYFAAIPDFDGLWAVGKTPDEAARELYTALYGWIDVHVKIGKQRPPVIDNIDLFAPPKAVSD
jgi:predicted RNase H-like HicB family nuclease